MILRQLFDYESYTYTYLLADEVDAKAAIIDPVLEKTDQYCHLLQELGLELVAALDTHVHADHITALGALRDRCACQSWVGAESQVDCASGHFRDNDVITVGNIEVKALYTPGHTSDSYCFEVRDGDAIHLFTGDTLLIRGTGRTDFQNGDPAQLHASLFQRLLDYPDHCWVHPGHDYRGNTLSTIGEERTHNPRLNLGDKSAFVTFMNQLDLPNPKLMDVAVPANRACGQSQWLP